MMAMILKEDIANKIKMELDHILETENIFKAGNFHKTNIRIFDRDRKQKSFKDFNYSDIHFEVFFRDKAQNIYVEVHFLNRAKERFESIILSKKFPIELEHDQSVGDTEKIIRLKERSIIYSHIYYDLAIEINIQLKLLKEKIEEIIIGFYK